MVKDGPNNLKISKFSIIIIYSAFVLEADTPDIHVGLK